MDARAEGALPAAGRSATVHRGPGAFRAPYPIGTREPDDRPERLGRSEDPACLAPVVGVRLHEGVRAGGSSAPAIAPFVPGVPLAAALRASVDELCARDRAVLPRRGGSLRRFVPGARAADARPAPAIGGVVQERDARE